MSLIVLLLYLFHKLATSVLKEDITSIDNIFMEWTNYRSSFLTLMFESVTIFGSVWWVGSISILIAFFYLLKKSWWRLFAFSTTMIGGVLLNILLKTMYQRTRPIDMEALHVLGMTIESVAYSFPSGHTMRSFIFYGLIIYWLINSNTKILAKVIGSFTLSILILLIGGSRIYLDAHYPTDILAGYAISLAWLLACIFAIKGVMLLTRKKVLTAKELTI